MLLDILEESKGALELPAVDGLGGLASVLERNTEVGTAGAGRLGGLNFLGGVTNLQSSPWLAIMYTHPSWCC